MSFRRDDVPWGEPAFVPVGALPHAGRIRGVFGEQLTFGHLAEAMHRVLVALGARKTLEQFDFTAQPTWARLVEDLATLRASSRPTSS